LEEIVGLAWPPTGFWSETFYFFSNNTELEPCAYSRICKWI